MEIKNGFISVQVVLKQQNILQQEQSLKKIMVPAIWAQVHPASLQ
jgi:hypothetical protein